jgi:hypothetical protein
MADTADRRSEGNSTKPINIQARKVYNKLASEGTCVFCAKTPVKNRKYCYDCSDKHIIATSLVGFRRIVREHTTGPYTLDQLLAEIASSNMKFGRNTLISMLELAKPKRKKQPKSLPSKQLSLFT